MGMDISRRGASPWRPVDDAVPLAPAEPSCGCRPREAASPPSTSSPLFARCARPDMTAVRTLVVRCPDWAVIAAGVPLTEPAAVFFANRVVASSPAARADGVTQHMRRREAQGRCPELVVLEHDPARDARAFEPIVATLDELTPRIEVREPGSCAFPTR